MNPPRLRYFRNRPLPDGAVYVGRPTKWGNPFKIGEPWPPGDPRELQHPATREDVLEAFDEYIDGRLIQKPPTRDQITTELRGKPLACWCPLGAACHADKLLEIANACSECDGIGWVHVPEHGCNGNERACAETCPVPVQAPCPKCNNHERPRTRTSDEEPF